jgi:sialic acid synthase SpsE
MQITLNNKKKIGTHCKPYFIAELNTSHFGDIDKAKKMIDMVKECGGDCVKFQSWSENTLYSEDYYKENPIAKRFVKKFSLEEHQLKDLANYAAAVGIDFASTPYSTKEVDFLINECNVPFIKVASMDINNYPFLEYIARTGSAVIISTGMATLEEIEKAVNCLENNGSNGVCIFHCVSLYPVKEELINLYNIILLKKQFGSHVIGYSDHSLGIDVGLASVALGACVIEKHVTLDKTVIGMDNQMAIEPIELRQMIQGISNVYKSLGQENRVLSSGEMVQKSKMRRSLVAIDDIQEGEILNEYNLGAKRPGTGISVADYHEYIGRRVTKNIAKDTLIQLSDLI